MQRTKIKDRELPFYTHGEEIANMVSHIAGGALGLLVASTCIVKSFMLWDTYKIVASFIYGISMILLYTVSSVYHGLHLSIGKIVMQIIDHCTIFLLISGTYTPICLVSLRGKNEALGWTVAGIVWGVSAVGITLNAIDLKKYKVFSLICYVAVGWCIVLPGKVTLSAIDKNGFIYLLIGGLFYTVGAVLYAITSKKHIKYMHFVFHIFVVLGSLFQYFAIYFYVL